MESKIEQFSLESLENLSPLERIKAYGNAIVQAANNSTHENLDMAQQFGIETIAEFKSFEDFVDRHVNSIQGKTLTEMATTVLKEPIEFNPELNENNFASKPAISDRVTEQKVPALRDEAKSLITNGHQENSKVDRNLRDMVIDLLTQHDITRGKGSRSKSYDTKVTILETIASNGELENYTDHFMIEKDKEDRSVQSKIFKLAEKNNLVPEGINSGRFRVLFNELVSKSIIETDRPKFPSTVKLFGLKPEPTQNKANDFVKKN